MPYTMQSRPWLKLNSTMQHLALVYTFDKSRAYPMGAKEELYTNHYVIKYLILVKDPKPTLICWISLLSKV